MSCLTETNVDIFNIIKEYLTIKDFNCLVNTNKKIKKECKELRYINLNTYYSLKYYNDKNYRNTILSLIEEPNKQLLLNIIDFSIKKTKNTCFSKFKLTLTSAR